MMKRQQLFLRPTVHGTPAGTATKTPETSAKTAKHRCRPSTDHHQAVTREMAKAHANYQAILNERSTATFQISLKVSSGANGFKVMDLFN